MRRLIPLLAHRSVAETSREPEPSFGSLEHPFLEVMMRRIKMGLVAGSVVVLSVLGMGSTASAADCSMGGDEADLSGVCQAVAKVVCKGRPSCFD